MMVTKNFEVINFLCSGTCENDMCYNGGTCILNFRGDQSCACTSEFSGPRCEQTYRKFIRCTYRITIPTIID